MNRLKLSTFLVAGVLAAGIPAAQAMPFHAGGTGSCDGCHGPNSTPASYSTLRGADPGSTCLLCHAAARPIEHQIATNPVPPKGVPPVSLTPGGDFAYLRKNYFWGDSNGKRGVSPGERHGHNIVAAAYGYSRDTTLLSSPGGSYPSDALSCTSCHDPHGNYRVLDRYGTVSSEGNPIGGSGSYGAAATGTSSVGTYRLLAGRGYQTKSAGHVFSYDPPMAVSPTSYNRSEASSDTRVAYGKGVSKWCANCHEGLLSGTGASHIHPADVELGAAIAMTYNNYVKSGDLTGIRATAYTSLVPFQSGEATDPQQLSAELTSTAGPNPEDRITCLTCHRAHASGWDSIGRWNMKGDFLTVAGMYPGIDTNGTGNYGENSTGKLRTEYQAAMYGRDASRFAIFQRQLCDKCHAKD